MAKFSTRATAPKGTGPVVATAPARTHEGGAGFSRVAKSELFMLALSNMVGESTFYEAARDRDERFARLVAWLAVEDIDWLTRFGKWLRREGFMRSAPVVLAAEAVHARLEAGFTGRNRQLVDAVLERLDEPKELFAYWRSRFGAGTLPKPIKRGLADAMTRMTTEYAAMKYDGSGADVRLGDVIELVRPTPQAPWQADLFAYLLDRRHHPSDVRVSFDRLPTIRARRALEEMAIEDRRAWLGRQAYIQSAMQAAGVTWEWLSGWLPGGMDAQAWEAAIPVMGHMALIRNLRNFDEAGISDDAARYVVAQISNPDVVARGMQFPYRYWAAHKASSGSLRWGRALSAALDTSTDNIPALRGRTLVLVDTSASMNNALSAKSEMTRAEAAAVFGVAAAKRTGKVDLVGFASGAFEHRIRPGDALLTTVQQFVGRIGEVGHGTDMNPALQKFYKGHDRILVFSDEQVARRVNWPAGASVYVWNLGGYAASAVDTSQRGHVELGGLSDATFKIIPLIEAGRDASWPF